jgi:hypothetical protein
LNTLRELRSLKFCWIFFSPFHHPPPSQFLRLPLPSDQYPISITDQLRLLYSILHTCLPRHLLQQICLHLTCGDPAILVSVSITLHSQLAWNVYACH